MKHFKQFILISTLATALSASAGSNYPTQVPHRTFGSNQDVGSCQSESFVGAVEHQLARIGAPFRVSLQHTHPYVWSDKSAEEALKVGLIFSGTTRNILSTYGGIVPDYYLPEDLEGVDKSSLVTDVAEEGPQKTRIPIENLGIYDGGFNGGEVGFSVQHLTFNTGFSNSRTFADLMNLVRAGQMVTLSFDADFIYKFHNVTGLLMQPYASDDKYFDSISHSVAIVGFDDDLGGLIIRNTWNDSSAQEEVDNYYKAKEREAQLEKDLNLFRRKINSRILPGYYLFPYAFIEEMVRRKVGGFRVLTANLGSLANQYAQNLRNYQIINAVYTCDWLSLRTRLRTFKTNLARYKNESLPEQARIRAYRTMISQVFGQISKASKTLNFAKQTRRVDGGIDRVKDFYAGNFAGYYCGGKSFGFNPDPKASFWPLKGRDAILDNPKFMPLVEKISVNYADLDSWFNLLELLTQTESL